MLAIVVGLKVVKCNIIPASKDHDGDEKVIMYCANVATLSSIEWGNGGNVEANKRDSGDTAQGPCPLRADKG